MANSKQFTVGEIVLFKPPRFKDPCTAANPGEHVKIVGKIYKSWKFEKLDGSGYCFDHDECLHKLYKTIEVLYD